MKYVEEPPRPPNLCDAGKAIETKEGHNTPLRQMVRETARVAPTQNGEIEPEVCADITARQLKGVKKYGITIAANPLPLKAWLQHAYEECLDQAIYLKRAIKEIE